MTDRTDLKPSPTTAIHRVGVIGGGQLAWMMAAAAQKLAIELVIQTPEPTDPAVAIAAHTVLAPVGDAAATAQLAAHCDVITFENEFVDLNALGQLAAQGVRFSPPLSALAPLLDKYDQRIYVQNLGIPVPPFWAEGHPSADHRKTDQHSVPLTGLSLTDPPFPYPVVLKTRRHGYDGQGTFVIPDRATWQSTVQKLANVPWLVEAFVPFDRELAVMVARSTTGEIVVYPVVETQQEEQVCRRVFAPASVDSAVIDTVETLAHKLLDSLEVVGIFGIELFLTKSGQVLVNEIAPRTHNSGHYTLDACATSQFEQQLRAVCGLPLGNPTLLCDGAVMVNLLGYEVAQQDYADQRQQLSALPNAHVHWYGKTESRPGRKLGHVTVLLTGEDIQPQAVAMAKAIEAIWYPS
jgi:5-(carboxyamino)imidazole ribonucleotide synthase